MEQIVRIISSEHLTHDVLRLVVEKPGGLTFIPGQAVDISINNPEWKDVLRPFTFTSLPEDNHLEFTIKTYPFRNGVTNQLLSLGKGDELIIHKPFGDIHYKGEGIFIAGGAGVTPFIAIFKNLEKNNKIGNSKLIFANKAKEDIILEEKFSKLLGKNFINILSDEERAGYAHGYITAEFLKKHIDNNLSYYYLCGPDPMMDAVEKQLASLGVAESSIVKEGF
ncbi:MAG: FAD-binding oxidoreductase [Mariniphaga sp.]|jgi:ferredoxin-NADP reductase|nr:FAD-binding oxidoreductase [Mariniphaga sp.]